MGILSRQGGGPTPEASQRMDGAYPGRPSSALTIMGGLASADHRESRGGVAVPVTHQLALALLPDTFAICRLDVNAAIPAWTTAGSFVSITRTAEDLSLVCLQSLVPDGIRCERDWRCFKLAGPIPFTTVGVLASLVQPLAEAGISIFAISTFDTDYVLVKETSVEK